MTHLVHRRHMRRILATCLILTIMTGSINAFRHRQCNSKMMCAGTQLTIRKSIGVLYSTELSNDVKAETTAIDSIRELPPNPILERVQKGLARLTENIPRPVLITVVAVASGLLFFELSKALLILALPIIAVLGGVQSLTEGLEGAAKGPRIYDTDAIDSTGVPSSSSSSSSAFPEYHTQKGTAEWGSTSSSSTSSTLEELERLSKERSGRLAAIQRRISETSGDLRSAISSASSLRDKLSSYVDKIDKVGAKSKVSK